MVQLIGKIHRRHSILLERDDRLMWALLPYFSSPQRPCFYVSILLCLDIQNVSIWFDYFPRGSVSADRDSCRCGHFNAASILCFLATAPLIASDSIIFSSPDSEANNQRRTIHTSMSKSTFSLKVEKVGSLECDQLPRISAWYRPGWWKLPGLVPTGQCCHPSLDGFSAIVIGGCYLIPAPTDSVTLALTSTDEPAPAHAKGTSSAGRYCCCCCCCCCYCCCCFCCWAEFSLGEIEAFAR